MVYSLHSDKMEAWVSVDVAARRAATVSPEGFLDRQLTLLFKIGSIISLRGVNECRPTAPNLSRSRG
jgi:hypothetical protein